NLGWVSGTGSTLRNTGIPLKRSSPTKSFALPLDRTELFEYVDSLAQDGSWQLGLTGGFSSFPTGAANFLFFDRSARLLNDTIKNHVYRLLGNRSDGEMIDADQY